MRLSLIIWARCYSEGRLELACPFLSGWLIVRLDSMFTEATPEAVEFIAKMRKKRGKANIARLKVQELKLESNHSACFEWRRCICPCCNNIHWLSLSECQRRY